MEGLGVCGGARGPLNHQLLSKIIRSRDFQDQVALQRNQGIHVDFARIEDEVTKIPFDAQKIVVGLVPRGLGSVEILVSSGLGLKLRRQIVPKISPADPRHEATHASEEAEGADGVSTDFEVVKGLIDDGFRRRLVRRHAGRVDRGLRRESADNK